MRTPHFRTTMGLAIALALALASTAAADNYLDVASVPSTYNITASGFTVECWIRATSLPGFDPRIIRCVSAHEGPCGDTGTSLWELFICHLSACNAGTVAFGIQSAGACQAVFSNAGIANGNWHHVAGTYDGTTLAIYVDGGLSATQSAPGLTAAVAGGKLVVGDATALNNPYDGYIDELRVWSVARSASDIASSMNMEISPAAQLVGYWRLNGDGTDLSGGNTLTPHGAVSFQPGELNQAAHVPNVAPPPPPPPPTGVPATNSLVSVGLISLLMVAGALNLRRRGDSEGQ